MLSPERVLRGYFHAKDENRPHVLGRVFTEDAELLIANTTSTISFPARTLGRQAIADVLVRDFGRAYENVYTFYFARPSADVQTFSCHWLVAMSEKLGRSARVGCGRYDWAFSTAAPRLATRLVITIDAMLVRPPRRAGRRS